MKYEIKAETLESIIAKYEELIREYELLINLSSSTQFFNIPSVNILKSQLSALKAEAEPKPAKEIEL